MGDTFKWCQDKSRLNICDKQVFYIDELGDKNWLFNGIRHRENGPAIENATEHKEWWVNGIRHRVNGPAIEYANGDKSWYLKDACYTEPDYWIEISK